MISIPSISIVGEEVNTFVNHRLSKIVEELLAELIETTVFETTAKLSEFFPKQFQKMEMKSCVNKILDKLKSEEEMNLTLVEEYVLAKILDRKIKDCEEECISTIKKMETRSVILCSIVDQGLAENEKEVNEMLSMVEDLKNYLSIFFEDWDYAFCLYARKAVK